MNRTKICTKGQMAKRGKWFVSNEKKAQSELAVGKIYIGLMLSNVFLWIPSDSAIAYFIEKCNIAVGYAPNIQCKL